MERLPEFIANNWYLFVALVAVLVWMFASEFSRVVSGVKPVDASQATRLYNKEDALFLDVRAENDFGKGHIPGAINITPGNLDKKNKRLERNKQKPVIVYCQNGMSSGKAGKQLRNLGFEQVYQLKGGIASWEAASLPIESK
ncbi:MAG: rhodanese-like domain-containing protein [Ectothiorhodospiraceae bacterium]|nr:rhodanese-like domain-containing protein [Ectothiorhodospiraceae bacterium]MCH8504100.1 rhodanese-like domain-containing protein [Ectothiorhodospiraceae bacterium]